MCFQLEFTTSHLFKAYFLSSGHPPFESGDASTYAYFCSVKAPGISSHQHFILMSLAIPWLSALLALLRRQNCVGVVLCVAQTHVLLIKSSIQLVRLPLFSASAADSVQKSRSSVDSSWVQTRFAVYPYHGSASTSSTPSTISPHSKPIQHRPSDSSETYTTSRLPLSSLPRA